jgi:hypothetical protein
MVRVSPVGMAPAPQALASRTRETRSRLRTSPQEKERRKVPRLDTERSSWPSTTPVDADARPAASSMQSPPANAEWIRAIALMPTLARPGASPRFTWVSNSSASSRCCAKVAGRSRPALATRRSSSNCTDRRSRL